LRKLILLILAAVVLSVCCASLEADDRAARAESEALSRAFAMLYRRLGRLQLTPDLRVQDFLASGPDIRALVYDAIGREARVTPPQHYSDGVVVVQIYVPIADLNARLSEVCRNYGRDERFKPQEFRKILLYTDRLGLWGFGQSRGQAAPGVAADGPPGWREVGVFGRLRARHQAAANAYRRLFQKTSRLRLSPSRTVADFLDSDKRIAPDMLLFVRSHPIAGPVRYLPQRLCEVDAAVRLADLIAELKSLANAYGTGGEFAADAFNDLTLYAGESVLRVTGVAVAEPAADGPQQAADAETVWPEVAQAEPPDGVTDPRQSHLLTIKAAEAKARRRLREKVFAQPIGEKMNLGHWMLKTEGVKADIEMILRNLRLAQVRNLKGGSVEVIVDLPVDRLNELLAHYRKAAKTTNDNK